MIRLSRAIAVAGLAFAAVTIAHTSDARADANAPVCAQGYGKLDGLSCNYANYAQCRAAISGTPASCMDNPYLRAAQNQMRPRDARR